MRQVFAAVTLGAVAAVLCAAPLDARGRARETFFSSANQAIDAADAQIAKFKADLRLTPEQDKHWGSVQGELHDTAVRRTERFTRLHEQRSVAEPNRPDDLHRRGRDGKGSVDIVAFLRDRADAMTTRADDMRRFADAAGPLYADLDRDQRRLFDDFVGRTFGDKTARGQPR